MHTCVHIYLLGYGLRSQPYTILLSFQNISLFAKNRWETIENIYSLLEITCIDTLILSEILIRFSVVVIWWNSRSVVNDVAPKRIQTADKNCQVKWIYSLFKYFTKKACSSWTIKIAADMIANTLKLQHILLNAFIAIICSLLEAIHTILLPDSVDNIHTFTMSFQINIVYEFNATVFRLL